MISIALNKMKKSLETVFRTAKSRYLPEQRKRILKRHKAALPNTRSQC